MDIADIYTTLKMLRLTWAGNVQRQEYGRL